MHRGDGVVIHREEGRTWPGESVHMGSVVFLGLNDWTYHALMNGS